MKHRLGFVGSASPVFQTTERYGQWCHMFTSWILVMCILKTHYFIKTIPSLSFKGVPMTKVSWLSALIAKPSRSPLRIFWMIRTMALFRYVFIYCDHTNSLWYKSIHVCYRLKVVFAIFSQSHPSNRNSRKILTQQRWVASPKSLTTSLTHFGHLN